MGKAYANRKPLSERPAADFYSTPYSLTRELLKLGIFSNDKEVYEPACGSGAITHVLKEGGFLSKKMTFVLLGEIFLTVKSISPIL